MSSTLPPDEPMTCESSNVAEFNAALRALAPEMHALAVELYRRGMIDGLRGAMLGAVGSLTDEGVQPVLGFESERALRDREASQG